MTENKDNWYYADNGKQNGPLDLEEIKTLINDKKITRETSVWNGEGDWKPAKDTPLFSNDDTAPPPLSGRDIDNKYVWFVVAVPLIGLMLELITGTDLLFVYLALNIGFCVLDERKLKAAGHEAPSTVWAFIIPVYLWKRATLLQQQKYYFTGWMVTFFVSILLTIGAEQNLMAEASCRIVTEIIQAEYGEDGATCKVVIIDEEVTAGFYKATATLDTGADVNITIEEQENDMLFVRIVE